MRNLIFIDSTSYMIIQFNINYNISSVINKEVRIKKKKNPRDISRH